MADLSVQEIEQAVRETKFSGVVSVSALGGAPSLEVAAGFADRGHRIAPRRETRFAMASGSKVFTAAAVGLLIQEGKVGLDTRLADCVRSRKRPFDPGITLEHLLNHTSGIADYFDEETPSDFAALWRDRPCYRMTSVRDFLPLFENEPRRAAPGAGFHYNNAGYVLLGLVIEEVTGRDCRDFIADRVFRPCGMNRTGYFALDALPEDTAVGYLSSLDDNRRTNIYAVPSVGGPDGGAFTTTGDLHLFWSAWQAGRLLKREIADRFASPSVRINGADESCHYGYGVWLEQKRGKWILSILGSDPGVSMVSRFWPDEGRIMTILSNVTDGAWALNRDLSSKIDEI